MDPFIGEIKLLPWNWAPVGWALCDGSILSITQNTALFSLLGTQYGGNGTTNFALPDLRGRTPLHRSANLPQGEEAGEETVTLHIGDLPAHNHAFVGTTSAASTGAAGKFPHGAVLATPSTGDSFYSADTTPIAINPASVQLAGSGQPHNNMQPYLVLNYAIALRGVFPSRG